MELRRLLMIAALSALPLSAAVVRTTVLDPTVVYTIRLATDEPTTCLFPGPLSALDGASIAAQPSEAASVLLSHEPGRNFFSVRALREEAKAGLNVVYQGRVYALRFTAGVPVDRSVTFRAEAPEPKPERLKALIEDAKHWPWRIAQHPALADAIERSAPATVTLYRNFSATLDEVFRWDAEGVLVFHLTLRNSGERAIGYDSDRLGVRLGTEVWTALAANASGAIPPQGCAHAYFAIRSSLPATAPFSAIVPAQ